MGFFQNIFWTVRKINVYALVGESGTGKSFRAKLLAEKLRVELIIDDGLLIHHDKIIAGHSAKREKTFLAAVKTALFDDKKHRDEAAKALQRNNFKKILILGTSEKMVNKIAVRLQIPQPKKIIKIEEIATREEIEAAMRSRRVEGKHVIPVPSLEIQRNYPQIFYDKVRLFFKKKKAPLVGTEQSKLFEKSVVRPEFSKVGAVEISESALTQMVFHCVEEYDKGIVIKKLSIRVDTGGYELSLTVDIPFGTQLTGKIHQLQKYIIENIERYTGILIVKLNIIIDKIITDG
ncbi:peptide ABC transporter ATPase [Treponema pedis]|uniref:peptide ABC transporter ATPase n=1 Tax=Treponema pedis TaxID=409322 RepID=UPI00041AD40E|nr:peptide ABC transporter ATPase [Treponema pedis]